MKYLNALSSTLPPANVRRIYICIGIAHNTSALANSICSRASKIPSSLTTAQGRPSLGLEYVRRLRIANLAGGT